MWVGSSLMYNLKMNHNNTSGLRTSLLNQENLNDKARQCYIDACLYTLSRDILYNKIAI
jgi:hypothetical protein